MIFRIDNNDNAQLIFVNKKIQSTLGFSPQDYVLASETESLVRRELDGLVEEVARLSHQKGQKEDKQIVLHTKRGEKRELFYDFELFKVKSSTASFLSIDFKETAAPTTAEGPATDAPPLFIAESAAMKSVMKHVDSLISTSANILVRGEKSTGKKSIARIIARSAVLSGSRLLEIDATREAVSSVKEVLKGRSENLVFVIANIDCLSVVEQRLLKLLLDDKESGKIRVIATSSQPLENLIEQGQFDSDLYYSLLFHTLLLPPLRNRTEDISEIVTTWTYRTAKVLSLPELHISETELGKLLKKTWPGNFDELFSVLRKSLLSAKHGKVRIEDDVPKVKPTKNGEIQEILPYDEMNRRYLTRVLQKTKNKIYGDDGAAKLLGLKPTTLQSKLKKLGIR